MVNPINLAHILVTGPFLIYLGLAKNKPIFVYYILIALALFLASYLLYKIFVLKYISPWLVIHVLVFVPLLLYSGIAKQNTHRFVNSLFLAIGCAAVGYHLARLVTAK